MKEITRELLFKDVSRSDHILCRQYVCLCVHVWVIFVNIVFCICYCVYVIVHVCVRMHIKHVKVSNKHELPVLWQLPT